MKHFARIAAITLLGVGLMGCGTGGSLEKFGNAVQVITVGVPNPVGINTIAGLKSAYGIAAEGAAAYGRLPRCGSGVSQPCRSITTQQIKAYNRVAYRAVQDAAAFGDAKTVNAQVAFNAAVNAISALRSVAPNPK